MKSLDELLVEHTRLSQALLGHTTVNIVPDIGARFQRLLDNEAEIRQAVLELTQAAKSS